MCARTRTRFSPLFVRPDRMVGVRYASSSSFTYSHMVFPFYMSVFFRRKTNMRAALTGYTNQTFSSRRYRMDSVEQIICFKDTKILCEKNQVFDESKESICSSENEISTTSVATYAEQQSISCANVRAPYPICIIFTKVAPSCHIIMRALLLCFGAKATPSSPSSSAHNTSYGSICTRW